MVDYKHVATAGQRIRYGHGWDQHRSLGGISICPLFCSALCSKHLLHKQTLTTTSNMTRLILLLYKAYFNIQPMHKLTLLRKPSRTWYIALCGTIGGLQSFAFYNYWRGHFYALICAMIQQKLVNIFPIKIAVYCSASLDSCRVSPQVCITTCHSRSLATIRKASRTANLK